MNIIPNITTEMCSKDKEIYFKHMEMVHRLEQQKLVEQKTRITAMEKKVLLKK